MPDLRVLVIGAGSIGRRHALNLLEGGAKVDVADPDPARSRSVHGTTAIAYDNLQEVDAYDGIVIASPTARHLEQATWALTAATKVLVEKPLAMDATSLDAVVAANGHRIMVGYNLRFHAPVMRYMKMFQSGIAGRPLSVRAWFGSWLPTWRPAVDYRQTYSARAELGGGVLLDAIHELDLLCWMLPGPIEVIGAVVDQLGDLEIDVEDTVKALLRHTSGIPIELSLDYLSRRYRRGLEVIGSTGNLTLDWSTDTITIETADGVSTATARGDVADSYRREDQCFLAWLRGGPNTPVMAEAAAATVRLADAIRESAR